MTVLTAEDLLFDHDDIQALFAACEVAVTDSEIDIILTKSIGYPLGVVITVLCMAGGKPFWERTALGWQTAHSPRANLKKGKTFPPGCSP